MYIYMYIYIYIIYICLHVYIFLNKCVYFTLEYFYADFILIVKRY